MNVSILAGGSGPLLRSARWVGFRCLAALMGAGVSLSAAEVTLTPEAPTLNLSGRDTEVRVNAAGIPGWQVKVPKGQAVVLRFDPVRVLIDITTPKGNQGVVTVKMPDGATADLGAASSARFDWFKDQTYYFSGAGKVSARSQQGIVSSLSGYFPPMTGGVREQDAGDNNAHRRSPLVVVHVLGDSGKELHVRVDQEEVRVKLGEVRRVTHPNGSILELSHDEKLDRLRWKVIKGYFEFDLPETECWRAYTVTDQEGGLRPEAGGKGADVLNLSPENIVHPNQNIFADLHHNVTAAVHRRADFHYRPGEDCAHYDASSKGGPVDLSSPVQPGANQAGAVAGGSVLAAGLSEPFRWTLQIPDGDAVVVGLSDAKQLVDFKTGVGNTSTLTLRMADGGRAEIGVDSSARLDWFKDQTYYLVGSGQVVAVNTDGQKFVLGPLQPPLTGGPVVITTDANGDTHTTQLSPVTPVKIVGRLGEELIVQVGSQQVTIPVDGSQTITLPNGSDLTLTQSADTRNLIWEADKGFFQFKVEGTGRWQAEGLTDQSAAMQWSDRVQTGLPGQIDIKNLSDGGALLVSLPGRNFAEVFPESTLQFAQGDGPQFFASAVDGNVVVYNSRTGTEIKLEPSDQSLRAGGLDPDTSRLSQQPITVFGDEQTLMQVRGESTTVSLLDNTERVLYGRNGSELTVDSPLRGTLTLESTTGGHAVELQALSGWSIDLPSGEKLTLVMDIRRGIITATTGAENTDLVRIVTADGFTPVLPPDTTITFILNRDHSLSSADGFGKLPGVDLTGTIQEPLIVQPPITVIR